MAAVSKWTYWNINIIFEVDFEKRHVHWIAREFYALINVWKQKPLYASCLPTVSFSTFKNCDCYKADIPRNRGWYVCVGVKKV